ncbi:MAG: methylated-DNA--[protein]-cysteine S-methyltransferase [Planctomycetota bacterium]
MKPPPTTAIRTRNIETPLGPMLAGVREPVQALCLLEFADPSRIDRSAHPLATTIGQLEPAEQASPAAELLDEIEGQLADYFACQRTAFDLPVHAPGTPFQQQVWNHLLTIPHGQTTTYGRIAAALGNPNGQRAVGAANAANRIAIIIPCHRVISSTGTPHGYAGGIRRKHALLELERATLFSGANP